MRNACKSKDVGKSGEHILVLQYQTKGETQWKCINAGCEHEETVYEDLQ